MPSPEAPAPPGSSSAPQPALLTPTASHARSQQLCSLQRQIATGTATGKTGTPGDVRPRTALNVKILNPVFYCRQCHVGCLCGTAEQGVAASHHAEEAKNPPKLPSHSRGRLTPPGCLCHRVLGMACAGCVVLGSLSSSRPHGVEAVSWLGGNCSIAQRCQAAQVPGVS